MATLTKFPPSYLYTQYADDDDLQALVTAYNQYQQAYLDTFIGLNLPIYTLNPISGALLDWVGVGLYGVARGYLATPSATAHYSGAYNTFIYNKIPYNARKDLQPPDFSPMNDDIYRRVITWQFFKGDGKIFNIAWLKRRCARFIYGSNGIDPGIQETSIISVGFSSGNVVTITVPADIANADLLKQSIETGILPLPFQYSFSVTLS